VSLLQGAYVRQVGIVPDKREEDVRTVAATTPPSELKPRATVVQVNSTVTPLTEEPDEITNPYWERAPKKRPLAHPNPTEYFCPTGEHLKPPDESQPYDDPNRLREYSADFHVHNKLYQPWVRVKRDSKEEPIPEVGPRPPTVTTFF
jgi:hypothetical protein